MFRRVTIIAAGLLLAMSAGAAFAQAGGAASPAQGFTPQMLIMKLSLYLPEDATRGAFFGAGAGGAAAGQRAGAGGTGAQAQGGAQAQAGAGQAGAAGGAQAGAGQAGAGGQGNGARRQVLQFTRDQKLFLTKDQITRLLPILQGLRENPMPSPTKARKVESDVDAILTAAQKAEWAGFQKQLESFQQSAQRQGGAAGGTGAAGSGAAGGSAGGAGAQGGGNGAMAQQYQNFQNMTPEQRQAFIDNLPPDQRQAVQQRMQRQGQGGSQGGAGGGQALTPTQRRQQQIDEFISVLQTRLKQL